jgi:YebC/PmpR family DNA-binding regulatory protein
MAGHSHFANIMHKKGKADAKRGKVFSKVARLIAAAVRMGGPKVEDNPRLQLALEKARAANMPKDTIQRAIDRASGAGDTAEYVELTYEAYGPGGVAMLIETLTENRNRTGGEVRTIVDRNGGSMGATGSVGWMFQRLGQIEVPAAATKEEALFELALEAGADDIQLVDGASDDARFLVTTSVTAFEDVKQAITGAGLEPSRAEFAMVPDTLIEASLEVAQKVMRIQGLLEENDDVQSVTTNLDVTEEVAAALAAEA